MRDFDWRGVGGVMLLAVGVTVATAAAVSLSPVRWDRKTVGQVVPQTPPGLRLSGRDILFVSVDNGWRDAHLARYGLDFVTFPTGNAQWMAFLDGIAVTGSRPDYAVDSLGGIHRWEAGEWRQLSEERVDDLLERAVLARSEDTLRRLSRRRPAFQGGEVHTIGRTAPDAVLESPRWRISLGQLLRLFWVILLPLAALTWATRPSRGGSASRLLDAALVVPAFLVAHVVLVYGLGFVTEHPVAWAIGLESLSAFGLILQVGREDSPDRSLSLENIGERVLRVLPWGLVALGFACMVIFRLDFDGDLYTHWLPSARMHHLLGHHDPGLIVERYGVAHEATYPPGFPIVISTLMWIAGMSRESFTLGLEAHMAVFLYRGLIALLLASFLVALAATFRGVRGPGDKGWLTPVVAVPLVLPLFLGEPRSAEVFFVPMLGFAPLLFLAGATLGRDRYVRLGLALAVFGFFVKNDALLVVPLVVAPWYFVFGFWRGRRAGAMARDAGIALLVALPVVLWRIDLAGVVERSNFMFQDIGAESLLAGIERWPWVFMNAIELLLRSESGVVLMVLLPAITLFRALVGRARVELLIPAGIALYLLATSYVFVFSRTDPLLHLNAAYPRLLTHAVLAAILYEAWAILNLPSLHSDSRTRMEGSVS